MRIILVEDNESLAKGIAYRLADMGHAVDVLEEGLAADEYLRGDGGDVVVLDINLPGLDGLSILRNLRARGDMRPVIMLSARSDTDERIAGLDMGADDYLVKPFEMDELIARLRALGRRKQYGYLNRLILGPVVLDLDARQVEIDSRPVQMPRREVSVLERLMSAQGRNVSKQDLLEHSYGVGADVEESAVEVSISRLRKRLRPHGVSIGVQRGLGYAISLDPEP